MRKLTNQHIASRYILAIALACITTTANLNAAVSDWFFEKIINYTQTADNQAPASASGWLIEIAIEVDNQSDATAGTVSGGNIVGSLPLTWEDGEWLLEKEYISKAALDAEFPSDATYTLTLSGGTLGSLTQTATLPVEIYPNTPYLTGTVFSELSSVDAASDFELTWGASGTSSALYVEVTQEDPWIDFVDQELANSAVSYTIPANTLTSTGTFEGDLFFSNSTNAPLISGGFGMDGSIGHAKSLIFSITTEIPSSDILSWELEKGAEYIQESNNVMPTSPDQWFAFAAVETANPSTDATSATISGGGISGTLDLTLEEGEWRLYREYANQGQLDAEFPDNAAYTITLSGGDLGTISHTVTLIAQAYTNTPYFTGEDLMRLQTIDSSSNFTLNWNNAGANATGVDIDVEIDGAFIYESPDNLLPETTAIIPAGALQPGYCYDLSLYFMNIQTTSGTGDFDVDGEIFHTRVLKCTASTVLSNNVDAIVGAWQSGNGASNASGMLLFQADGTYFHAEDVVADGSEVDGMERGTYTWNSSSGLLTATPDTDTNGELGLSDPIGAFTATVDGNTLIVADSESTTLSRVNDPADAIVGGWRICDNSNNDTGTLIFLDNGIYFHAEVDTIEGSGMERGTYSWNSGTETLSINSTPVDTNIEIGLAGAGSLDASVTGRKALTIDDGETTQLYRVSNAAVLPEWRLTKSRSFTQTTNNTQPTVPDNWSIWGLVELRNTNDATSITLSGENGSGTPFTVSYTEEDPGVWTFDPADYTTQAALDADYPTGVTFTITLSGGELGTLTQEIQSGPGGYPTIPYLTDTVFSDSTEIDPTAAFDFTWNSNIGFSVQIVISSLMDEDGDEYFNQTELVGDFTDITIPAGTIPAGSTAYGYLEFNIVTFDTTGAGGFGTSGFASNHSTLDDFPIATLSTSAIIDNAYSDAGLTDPADTLPTSTPFDDGVENLLKYAFNMNLSGPDSSTLESGGDSGLPATGLAEVDGETVWQVEYVRPIGSGLIYTPKKSASLDTSFVPMVGAVSTQNLGNGLERITISEPCDPATTPTCFSIVEVTLP
ncbi:MAG: hypothetical protein ACSHX8_10455 [Opitutaceae bacterium]